jgi:MFS transporter, NNP family, nitrate/nitrite transporter
MTLVATVGWALNFWAWALVGPLVPDPGRLFDVGPVTLAVLAVAPLVIGSAGRIPVGALTDRFGGRVMLPAVSVVAATGVLLVALAGSGVVFAAATLALGCAGTGFAVGSTLVARWWPVGWRGLALGLFGAGMGGSAVAGFSTGSLIEADRPRASILALAIALAGYAALAALLIRDDPGAGRSVSVRQGVVATLRSPSTRRLAALYLVAYGGLISLALFLPTYLHTARGIARPDGLVVTATAVIVAAAVRPLGGWLADRNSPNPTLVVGFVVVAGCAATEAFRPPTTVAMIAGGCLAVGLGLTSGTLVGLVARCAPAHRLGATMGVVGAAGALGGMLPVLVLAVGYEVGGSYTVGMMLLAGTAVAAAGFVAVRGAELTAPLAPEPVVVPRPDDPVVIVVSPDDSGTDTAALAGPLAKMATVHELVIVYQTMPGSAAHALRLLGALRAGLPRHTVIAVLVDGRGPMDPAEPDFIAELIEDGSLPVAMVRGADPAATAAAIAQRLRTTSVTSLVRHAGTGEVRICPLWTGSWSGQPEAEQLWMTAVGRTPAGKSG